MAKSELVMKAIKAALSNHDDIMEAAGNPLQRTLDLQKSVPGVGSALETMSLDDARAMDPGDLDQASNLVQNHMAMPQVKRISRAWDPATKWNNTHTLTEIRNHVSGLLKGGDGS